MCIVFGSTSDFAPSLCILGLRGMRTRRRPLTLQASSQVWPVATKDSKAGRLCHRARCLGILRARLGDESFLNVASFAPMSCRVGLAESEQDHIAKRFRESICDDHWLTPYVDRPRKHERITNHGLAKAILPRSKRHAPLDADGVYALFALRSFAVTSITPAGDTESEGEDSTEFDSKLEDFRTPLCSAIGAESLAIVRLLLQHRANPNGNQKYRFKGQGKSQTKATPLYLAVALCQPDVVDTLLQARAEPEHCGYTESVREDVRLVDRQTYLEEMSPLWRAVSEACLSSPSSHSGITIRVIMRSLLLYGADPNEIGRVAHIGHVHEHPWISFKRSDWIDELGYVHLVESMTTPLEAALALSAGEWKSLDRQWSTDVVEACVSERPSS